MTTFVKCDSYERAQVEAAVEKAWSQLGGIGKFVKPGMRVLVKPNLLRDATPEEAVTTHPEVVRACVKKLLAIDAKVTVGDSPAFVANLAKVWKTTEIQDVCAELKVPLVSLEQQGCTACEQNDLHFSLCNEALDAELILNLPKVKTHGLTLLTAAAKNLYGLVPGHLKTQLHKTHPSANRFGELIRGIARKLPRVVTIADGVVGMEGDGPSSGTPVQLGFLAAGTDVFELDYHLCGVLGFAPSQVPTLHGTPAPQPATGDAIRVAPLKRPHASQLSMLDKLPKFLVRWIGRFIWFRPVISTACVHCGRCVKACPVEALKLDDAAPKLEASRCIGCCCCSEICPVKAITIMSSPLVRLAERF